MSGKESKEVNFESLTFRRVFTPEHIPKYLIEQVKDRDWNIDDWYKFQELICLRQTKNGPALNPLNLLYVISDDDYKVVGMLWAEINPLSKTLVIDTFSMDKSYWYNKGSVEILSKKAQEIARECNLKKILWSTRYPKHSERHGFKRSRSVLMELNMEKQDGQDLNGKSAVHGKCPTEDFRAEPVPEHDTGESRTTSSRELSAIPSTV